MVELSSTSSLVSLLYLHRITCGLEGRSHAEGNREVVVICLFFNVLRFLSVRCSCFGWWSLSLSLHLPACSSYTEVRRLSEPRGKLLNSWELKKNLDVTICNIQSSITNIPRHSGINTPQVDPNFALLGGVVKGSKYIEDTTLSEAKIKCFPWEEIEYF